MRRCFLKAGTGKKRKGFMLIELLIVVAILGILAAVAIPNFIGMTDEAKVARIQADLSAIGSAAEVYYVKNGRYPSSVKDMVDETGKDGFLRSEPKPPVKDTSYILNATTGEATYSFKGNTYSSFGGEKKQGG